MIWRGIRRTTSTPSSISPGAGVRPHLPCGARRRRRVRRRFSHARSLAIEWQEPSPGAGRRRSPNCGRGSPRTQTTIVKRTGKILTTFRELGVLPEIADALDRAGITTPFPIQEMTLSVALMGTDLIGQARTGTG